MTVVGVRGGQRTEACRASLLAAGHDVRLLAWRDVLAGRATSDAVDPGGLVRIESPSDDPRLDELLVRRGGGRSDGLADGTLMDSTAWVRGLGHALSRLDDLLTGSSAVRLYDGDSVATMFDKTETQSRLRAAGVPTAPPLPDPAASLDEIVRAATGLGWNAVFAKSRFGSSGSGLCALRWAGERFAAYTTVGFGPDGTPVNVGLQRLRDPAQIRAVLAAIEAAGGVHVERWVPKLAAQGGAVDLRVVVVAGQARQVLVRVGTGPLTNLHLGARRGDVGELATALGTAQWKAVLSAAEAAAGCFPRAHHAGVDVGIDSRGRPFILELNAFGDFHEGIVDRDGYDTYAAEIELAPDGVLR